MTNTNEIRLDKTPSGRPMSSRPASSRPESDRSELTTNEILRRLREKSDREKQERDLAEINAMGPYNAFSRPKPSMVFAISFFSLS
jgi:hypothetical protein